ncbi:hypothetical protein Rsub_03942 [Raphidocelis subcapitata]|uniref:ERCC4 domain-containing protein n=1 Tax=Raphidocelis subcapitata TaxID=307507 RepID=A0A2V0NVH0_9CHLO|nr:hypothetical protein Rsub_03942 [Raphidocelis subcapitata]|eukprot:GBF91638.1 hypothetical protein Rsub_03942 [Raphidocelis subcapitata]
MIDLTCESDEEGLTQRLARRAGKAPALAAAAPPPGGAAAAGEQHAAARPRAGGAALRTQEDLEAFLARKASGEGPGRLASGKPAARAVPDGAAAAAAAGEGRAPLAASSGRGGGGSDGDDCSGGLRAAGKRPRAAGWEELEGFEPPPAQARPARRADGDDDGGEWRPGGGSDAGGGSDEDWGEEEEEEEDGGAPARRPAKRGKAAGSKRAAGSAGARAASGSGGGGSGGGGGGGGAPASRRRKTAEQREAEAAEKEARKAERERARAAKAAAKIQEKLDKELSRLSDRQANGGLFDREIVLTMPRALADSALGRAVAALLQAKRWGMWRADGGAQPLAAEVERLGGRAAAAGCHVVTFQRRRLGLADVKSVPEIVELAEPFEEAAPVPCVLLLFTDPGAFASLLRAPGGGLTALLERAAALHPDCSLQAVVVGLDSHARAQERRDFASGGGGGAFSASDVRGEVLRLQLACPALQLRKVPNVDAAAEHLLSLTRALGQQPYKHTSREDALAASGAGASFAAAAAAGMASELGPAARRVAQCLARVPGVGGGHAWALCREFGGLGALTQAFLREAAAGRDPARVVSELRDARGAQQRLGPALGARLVALLTTTDPDAPVGRGDD